MLLKIHTSYIKDGDIGRIETVAGPDGGFRVHLLFGQADVFIPCPEGQIAAALEEIDAQLARANVVIHPDDAPPALPYIDVRRTGDAPPAGPAGPEGPEGPKPPRGGYF